MSEQVASRSDVQEGHRRIFAGVPTRSLSGGGGGGTTSNSGVSVNGNGGFLTPSRRIHKPVDFFRSLQYSNKRMNKPGNECKIEDFTKQCSASVLLIQPRQTSNSKKSEDETSCAPFHNHTSTLMIGASATDRYVCPTFYSSSKMIRSGGSHAHVSPFIPTAFGISSNHSNIKDCSGIGGSIGGVKVRKQSGDGGKSLRKQSSSEMEGGWMNNNNNNNNNSNTSLVMQSLQQSSAQPSTAAVAGIEVPRTIPPNIRELLLQFSRPVQVVPPPHARSSVQVLKNIFTSQNSLHQQQQQQIPQQQQQQQIQEGSGNLIGVNLVHVNSTTRTPSCQSGLKIKRQLKQQKLEPQTGQFRMESSERKKRIIFSRVSCRQSEEIEGERSPSGIVDDLAAVTDSQYKNRNRDNNQSGDFEIKSIRSDDANTVLPNSKSSRNTLQNPSLLITVNQNDIGSSRRASHGGGIGIQQYLQNIKLSKPQQQPREQQEVEVKFSPLINSLISPLRSISQKKVFRVNDEQRSEEKGRFERQRNDEVEVDEQNDLSEMKSSSALKMLLTHRQSKIKADSASVASVSQKSLMSLSNKRVFNNNCSVSQSNISNCNSMALNLKKLTGQLGTTATAVETRQSYQFVHLNDITASTALNSQIPFFSRTNTAPLIQSLSKRRERK